MAPTEDTLIKKILDLQVILMNKHNLPTLFSYSSKFGQTTFGTKHVMEKFKEDFDDTWETTFDNDLDELMCFPANRDYFDVEANGQQLNLLCSELPPCKLPANLELMVYKELWRWISEEILKSHWKNGGEKMVVNYGNPEFLASFWPNEIWAWEDIKKNPKNMKSSDFPGEGNMTEFLKGVVRNCLEECNIDPSQYVTDDFSEKMKNDRQKKRGKTMPTVMEEATDANDELAGVETIAPTNESDTGEVPTPPTAGVDNAVDESDHSEDVYLSTATNSPANSQNLETNISGVDITDISRISEILASNDIQLNSSAVLQHNLLPNISSSSGLEPDAHSTFSREFPPSSPPNVESSAPLQASGGNQVFHARRRRPSQLNQNPVAAKRPRVAPCHVMTRRSSSRQSRNQIQNIHNTLNVELGPPRSPLKTKMFITNKISEVFKSAAAKTTAEGKELGGVLAGKFEDGAYTVTHVVIPQQTGGPMSWTVGDERQLNNFFITHPGLLFLGFIHSNVEESPPTSIDLHSLFAYCRLNPCFVSVVYSPQQDACRVFSLTDLGLRELSCCKQTDFHEHNHDVHRLYKDSPHVTFDENIDAILIDYRLPE